MKLNLKNSLVFFDLETTGTNIVSDRIVEISYLKVSPNGREESKTIRVNPEMHIPETSSAIHGIYDADVADCPTFKQVAKEIIKDIHFSARGFRKIEADKPKPENVDKSVDFVELGEDEIGVAEEVASICDSDELASRVKQAMMTSKRLRQLRAKENEADG